MGAGFASIEEIRKALADFKTSGKFVVAYGDQYSQRLYYLASVADKVMLNPQGSIGWYGLASTLYSWMASGDKCWVISPNQEA